MRNVSRGFGGVFGISPHHGHDNVTKPEQPHSNSAFRRTGRMALEESSVLSALRAFERCVRCRLLNVSTSIAREENVITSGVY